MGNYPLTVRIELPQTITMRDGRIRIPQELDLSVRVPDAILKCVGYVCEVTNEDATGRYGDPYATGFFVSIPCQSEGLTEMRMAYFVTAKHVATDLKNRPIYFSVNKRGGGVSQTSIGIPEARWWTHPTDPNADVAAVQVIIRGDADLLGIATETFALPERLQKLDIGIGDEVNAIGLFSAVPGNHSNMPIVRCGNIAMMPTEQVQTELGYTDVYLVEARSIGGMSGSPVFVRPTLRQKVRNEKGDLINAFFSGTGDTLLGMVQSHWDVREEDINKPSFTQDRKRGVNYGVAVVVPAQKIYETIYSPPLVAMRKEQEAKILRRNIPGSDRPDRSTTQTTPKGAEIPIPTQEQFLDDLTKASRRTEPKKP